MADLLRGVFTVNGVALNNPGLGCFVEGGTVTPGTWGQRVSSVELCGVDGTPLAGDLTLTGGELVLAVGVVAQSHTDRLRVEAIVNSLFRGRCTVGWTPGPAVPERQVAAVVQSVTVSELRANASRMIFNLMVPYPVWVETVTHTGTVGPGEVVLDGLEGGSGPATVTWSLPAGATFFTAKCVTSGERVDIDPGEQFGPVTVDGWESGLGARLSSWGRVHPDREGVYRVKVETNVEEAQWVAAKSFL